MNAICYYRVSTQHQSTISQQDAVRNYCHQSNLLIKNEFAENITGVSKGQDRPEFRKMFEFASNTENNIQILVVFEMSRLGRTLEDVLTNVKLLHNANVNVHIVKDRVIFDNSPINVFLFSLLGAAAEFEKSIISERMTNGKESSAKKGMWSGGITPYGYTVKDKQLTIDEAESQVVKRIFELKLQGIGNTRICQMLDDEGIKTRFNLLEKNRKVKGVMRNHKTLIWQTGTIVSILENRVYIGFLKHKKTEFFNKNLILIDNEDFEKANSIVNKRGVEPIRYEYLLKDVKIKCGVCGRNYYVRAWKEGLFYACSSERVRCKCGNHGISVKLLEEIAWYLCKVSPMMLQQYESQQDDSNNIERIEELKKLITDEEKKLNTYNEQRKKAQNAYVKGLMSEKELSEIIEEINIEQNIIEELINKYKGEESVIQENIRNRMNYADAIHHINNDSNLIKQYISQLIEKIEISTFEKTEDFQLINEKRNLKFNQQNNYLILKLKFNGFEKTLDILLANRDKKISYLNEKLEYSGVWQTLHADNQSIIDYFDGAQTIMKFINDDDNY